MTRILVPARSVSEAPGLNPPLIGVRSTYLNKLFSVELTPIVVAPNTPAAILEALYAEASGLLLTGGEDVDPKFYSESRHPTTESDSYGRDELEITLTKMALADRKPILGICRGCQVLAVAAGGSLHQHIPESFPGEVHNAASMLENEPHHKVKLVDGSKIAQIIGKTEISVNSFHHQAVKSVGLDMLVSGRSPAGVIESIEHRERRYFCLAVQSHPENETGDLEPIFKAFALSCR